MKVIFAEKPSQAKDYAEALGIKKRHDGYIEIKDSEIIKNAIVTWGFGHLTRLKLPKEYELSINTWKLENLPYRPKNFEYTVDKDKKKQFNIVKKLCKQADEIINATDIDREGSNIFYSTLKHAGIKGKPIKRLWINSLVHSEIQKGFKNLLDNQKDFYMYREAHARQISDYLIGMNLSPLYSLLFQKQGYKDIFSIGRVQTPLLYLIYQRQCEIENFKSEKFYEVIGYFKAQNGEYQGKAKIKTKDKKDLIELENKYKLSKAKQGLIEDISKETKNQKAPKLHSLSSLQLVINKQYKYSPEKTKDIVQTLYEKKIVSYPRTDSNLITEEEFNYLNENLESYQTLYDIQFKINNDYRQPRKKYVNSSKVQEHHAIIPTSQIPNQTTIKKLNEEEKLVLQEIICTTLSMFAEDHVYNETKVITNVNGLQFFSQGKQVINNGWKDLSHTNHNNDEDTNKLPQLAINEKVLSSVKTKVGKTTPPKLYTEGQLIPLMKTCGKHIDDEENSELLKEIEGLGTEATRSNIIKTLKDRKYIQIKKNHVYITEKGRLLCKSVAGTLLSSATMTAEWEKRLKYIGKGQAQVDSFIENTMKFINKEVNDFNQKEQNNELKQQATNLQQQSTICKCPNCNKGSLLDKGKVIKCNQCEQIFFKNFLKKKIPDKQLLSLFTKGKTTKSLKFKSKKGNDFSAYIKLAEDKNKNIKKLELDFDK
ncbi:TPA: DNA topoisomerase III [Staphylococcus aureus]|jgi:DNA topoisomerase-3|uniref:type IA DNA topoisomerase n=1 Tax=Staphylococcus TaxID=1279 RepID=UPI0007E2EAC9|nr:type IA DNA topoisomerase [Staphylococcus epidermidis]MDU4503930.1 DNA topoisomerase III [Staphylococcus warneri]MDU5815233.1 DNA topoisomerase III [Staphylococcus sp.]HEG7171109.1 DNA topoisomerase III [Staphylococcus aureus]MCG1573768.1 DNA topoisomerase III [Staphylococcus epidermidis]OAW62167.1 DNA topoisomerase III [Staphylococcus epidermidis]